MVCQPAIKAQHSIKYAPGKHPNSIAAREKAQLILRRCERENCNRPALKQHKFCYRCWKKYCSRKKIGNDPSTKDMPRFRHYSERMGPKLNAYVEQCLSLSEPDQFNLSEELAVARDLLGEAIELYERAKLLPANNPNRSNMLATAGALLSNASKEVRETCKVGAEIFDRAKDKFSVHSLVEVVNQIKRMIRLCFDHDQDGLQSFDAMLNEQLRLPRIGNDGTTITADQDVIDMDATIPKELHLICPECNVEYVHHDLNCVCANCNGELELIRE